MIVKIRQVAKKKKMTLAELSRRVGVETQTIHSWANGERQPTPANMDKLCTALDCQMDDIFKSIIFTPLQQKIVAILKEVRADSMFAEDIARSLNLTTKAVSASLQKLHKYDVVAKIEYGRPCLWQLCHGI